MLLSSEKEQQAKEEGTTITDKIQLSPISTEVSLSTSSFITSFVSFRKIFILNKTPGLHWTFYWLKWKSSSHFTFKEKRGKMVKSNKEVLKNHLFFLRPWERVEITGVRVKENILSTGPLALHLMLSKNNRAEWLSEINLNSWLIVILHNH